MSLWAHSVPWSYLGTECASGRPLRSSWYPKRPLDSPGAQELGPTIICHPTLGFLGSFEVTEVPVISLGVTQGQFLLKCNILAAFRGSPDPVSVGRSWSGMNPLEGLHYILVLSAAFRLWEEHMKSKNGDPHAPPPLFSPTESTI